jgi:hypothetical protein
MGGHGCWPGIDCDRFTASTEQRNTHTYAQLRKQAGNYGE